MEVYVKTIVFNSVTTIDEVYIDDLFICHSLEDTYRPNLPPTCPYTIKGQDCKCPQKIKGHTAIPGGRYRAKLMYSPKFKRWLLRLIDVPHFIGILFHRGNTHLDTEGCFIVGEWESRRPNEIKGGTSTPWENKLNEIWKLATETKPENSIEIWVTVDRDVNAPAKVGDSPFSSVDDLISKLRTGQYKNEVA